MIHHLTQVNNLPVNILPVTYPQSHSQSMYTPDDLPKTVVRVLNQGSTPMSMDFHPVQQTLLLGRLSLINSIIVSFLFWFIWIILICCFILAFVFCFSRYERGWHRVVGRRYQGEIGFKEFQGLGAWKMFPGPPGKFLSEAICGCTMTFLCILYI